MGIEDAEGEAAFLLREFDARRPPGARAVAERHLGKGSIVTLPGMRGADAELITLHGRPTICVRGRMTKEAFRWAVLHELSEWHLKRTGYHGDDVELVAEQITAALVVPREAYKYALRVHGEDWEQLAFGFMTTQSCVLLRHGEVTDEPLALVAPATLRVRGREWSWPDERTIRGWAKGLRPGLRKVHLTDDRRRVALVAGEENE